MAAIPLLVPHMPTAEQLLPFLREIDGNRHYTNFGPLNARFEEWLVAEVAPQLDIRHVTTVSNCTTGLELALLSQGLQAGARILVPGITFAATATAVARVGMQPVVADVAPGTWILTPEIARTALEETHIDGVMPVATFGLAQDTRAWDAFVSETGKPVVIDAAGAFGNQAVGQACDVVFSFHATKSFGAGEGGAVLSHDVERIALVRKLSNFGFDTRVGLVDRLGGTNAKMSEYHCAAALATARHWPRIRAAYIDLHQRYRGKLLKALPAMGLQDKPGTGVYPLMPVLLPQGSSAASTADAMGRQGIQTRRWYSPSLHMHPALQDALRMESLATAETLGDRLLGLPCFIGLDDDSMDRTIRVLSETMDGGGA